MLSHAFAFHTAGYTGVAFWIGLLGLALTLLYVVAPVTMRMKPGHLPAQLAPAVDVPPRLVAMENHLREMEKQLGSIGFIPAPPARPLISTSIRPTLMQLFVHPTNGDVASVLAMESPKTGIHTVLGFTAEFRDGTACYTGNSTLPSPLPPRPKSVRHRFPSERDPSRLYLLHRAVTARFQSKPRRPSQIDDSVAYQLEQERKSRRWMIDSGYYWLDGDRLRATWKGAFFGVWRNVPPWRTIAERRDERARRRLSGDDAL